MSRGQKEIRVRGATEHNLKGVDVAIPRGTLTTITGVSGSGKSSLAHDTIYQEGQRRFVESLSSYARQFLGQGEKPQVEHIEGLSPTVSVDQKTVNRNPRSTVGTITEVHDHLRLLFARLGVPHCPGCGRIIDAQSAEQVTERILKGHAGERIMVLAPIVKDRKGEYRKELKDLLVRGFVRARIDGEVRRLDEPIQLARYERHTIEVVLDRITATKEKHSRLAEAVEGAFRLGEGQMSVLAKDRHQVFSSSLSCIDCGIDVMEMEPRAFSFNSPHGACPACDGLGEGRDVDPRLVVPDEDLSIDDGAIAPSTKGGFSMRHKMGPKVLFQICDALKVPRDKPFGKLTKRQRSLILEGAGNRKITLDLSHKSKRLSVKRVKRQAWDGVLNILRDSWEEHHRTILEKFMSPAPCTSCRGARLKPESLAVKVRDQNIAELSALPIANLLAFIRSVALEGHQREIGERLLRELESRVEFLDRVGLGYLTVDRSAATLSGGESQRIRLATQVGSKLRGIVYVLDEPSIGLHQRDNKSLINTLFELRDAGNTVLVVEHDQETIEASDRVIDVGPGAGQKGGLIVAEGTPAALARSKDSVTGAFLSGKDAIQVPTERREAGKKFVEVKGASANNLKGIDVPFPLGVFTCVTGVSGSGKSTLVDGILKRVLARHFHRAEDRPLQHKRVNGLHHLDKVIEIDQAPIGRTPRSNPGTYTKVFDLIRDLFASLPESKARGYKKGRFSFNVKGGRCEDCQGAGLKVIEMHFLADVSIPCATCDGGRFNPETLEIRYRGKSINDVLEMTIDEAAEFFENHPKISRILGTLLKVGLGYIALGQPSTTLSGGEAQRVKLASQLHRPPTGRTLYLLDEPTTGLHFLDIRNLLAALNELVEAGNSVVVIEHNLDVIKCADWVIDLGPEGGAGGGELLYGGPLEGILDVPESHTGSELKELLDPETQRKRKRKHKVFDRALDGDVVVKGAAMHNLKQVEAHFPAGAMTVVTGLSGSGKTSLAFDTLFAEGQRRFVECLSTYARQFLGRLERPPLESIDGLAPAIAIDQKNAGRNPRSTVATTTEIQDYLRLLFARLGIPHCPDCGEQVYATPPDRAWKILRERFPDQKGMLLAPLYLEAGTASTTLREARGMKALVPELLHEGYRRIIIDGQEQLLEDKLPSLKGVSEIWLVVDRVQLKGSVRTRVLDSVTSAYQRGLGVFAFRTVDGQQITLSEQPGCADHGFVLPEELVPRMFSFNSHHGACEACTGLGISMVCDPERLVNEPSRPLLKGAMVGGVGDFIVRRDGYFPGAIRTLVRELGSDIREPWEDLPGEIQQAILHGYDKEIPIRKSSRRGANRTSWEMRVRWKGLCRYVEDWRRTATKDWWIDHLEEVLRQDKCASCHGERLKPAYRAVTVQENSIASVGRMTVAEAREWVSDLKFTGERLPLAEPILKELGHRLGFLESVGLEYIQLDRSAATLSGGESQRIRLATQIGNRLTGVIYVLDEPTIGLHQRDTARLLSTLKELRDLGNTLVVVEHDRDTIDRADWIVDLGPGAGHAGGEIVYQGARSKLGKAPGLTADYVSGRKEVVPTRDAVRKEAGRLELQGVKQNNIEGLDVTIPLGCLVAVTGVSGSGKSSLVMDSLAPAVMQKLDRKKPVRSVARLKGADGLAQCILVDQSPLGLSPRSNPASYIQVLDPIRSLMATAPAARMRGYTAGRFSFNTRQGRCETCDGRGQIQVEMHFLPDVWVECDECRGRRYNRETLTVEYRGKTIADILEMEVSEAVTFFENHARIHGPLKLLEDVGLGYMQLGQSATTLSGGEAQRVKLARELGRRTRGPVLYILDEPTTGLHFEDVSKLVEVLQRLVDLGHTVVVIEHNLDVILSADHIIDMGPEGGAGGGRIVAQGTPREVSRVRGSHTGAVLKPLMKPVARKNQRRRAAGAGG